MCTKYKYAHNYLGTEPTQQKKGDIEQVHVRPSKHETFAQCGVNVGPSSSTLTQH